MPHAPLRFPLQQIIVSAVVIIARLRTGNPQIYCREAGLLWIERSRKLAQLVLLRGMHCCAVRLALHRRYAFGDTEQRLRNTMSGGLCGVRDMMVEDIAHSAVPFE